MESPCALEVPLLYLILYLVNRLYLSRYTRTPCLLTVITHLDYLILLSRTMEEKHNHTHMLKLSQTCWSWSLVKRATLWHNMDEQGVMIHTKQNNNKKTTYVPMFGGLASQCTFSVHWRDATPLQGAGWGAG